MAARADVATDRCSRNTAPAMALFSICAWAKVVNSTASSFHPIARFSDAGDSTSWVFGFKGANGRTPAVYSGANTTGISGTEVALGTWIFVGATLSGTAAQIFWGLTPGTLAKATGTVAVGNGGAPTQFGVFGRSAADGSEWLDGELYGLRQWSGGSILSDAEMAAESLLAPSVSTPAARTTGLWHSIPFTAAALTDVSGNARPLTPGSTALSVTTDPPLGPIAGALTIGTTAAVAVGAFADRPRSLAVAATAQVATSPVRTTPGALTIGSTAQMAVAPVRETSGALTTAAVSQLGLVPLADRTAALGATSTAAVALDATSDRPAALAIGATSQVSVVPAADRAVALDVGAVAQLGLVPVQERAGALTISSQAGLQLLAGGQTPAALDVAAVAQLAVAPVRQAPGALDLAMVATVVLSSVHERLAALAVASRAQLDVVPARELERALAITVRAVMGLQQDAGDEGSLLLYVGAPEYRPWVRTGPGGERVWVGPTHAESIAWLITGRYRDR